MNVPQAHSDPPGMKEIDPNKANNDALKHVSRKEIILWTKMHQRVESNLSDWSRSRYS